MLQASRLASLESQTPISGRNKPYPATPSRDSSSTV